MERLTDRLTDLTAAAGLSTQPLAVDQAAPQIASAGGILPRRPQEFFHEPRIEATLDAGPTSKGPSTSHELPMPAQQRRWRHQERPPAPPRQQPGQRGQDQAICGGVMVPGNLAVLHGKLMPQDGDPGILVVWCGTDAHQSENVAARGERRG